MIDAAIRGDKKTMILCARNLAALVQRIIEDCQALGAQCADQRLVDVLLGQVHLPRYADHEWAPPLTVAGVRGQEPLGGAEGAGGREDLHGRERPDGGGAARPVRQEPRCGRRGCRHCLGRLRPPSQGRPRAQEVRRHLRAFDWRKQCGDRDKKKHRGKDR